MLAQTTPFFWLNFFDIFDHLGYKIKSTFSGAYLSNSIYVFPILHQLFSSKDTDLFRQVWHSVRQFVHVYFRLESGGKAIPLCIFSFNFLVIKCVVSVRAWLKAEPFAVVKLLQYCLSAERATTTMQNDSYAKYSFIVVAEQVLERLEGWKRTSKSSGGQGASEGTVFWVRWVKPFATTPPLPNVLISVQFIWSHQGSGTSSRDSSFYTRS